MQTNGEVKDGAECELNNPFVKFFNLVPLRPCPDVFYRGSAPLGSVVAKSVERKQPSPSYFKKNSTQHNDIIFK